MGRLRPGVSADEANAEMQTIAGRIEKAHQDTNEGWTVFVQTVRDNLSTGAALAMLTLYGSITFVLLIACANVANLLLARATVREKEIALRMTLGAGRLRLVRQLLTEAVVLSSVGGTLGFLLGLWGISVLRNMLIPDPNIGFLADVMHLNNRILFHTVGISVLAGLLFGLAPALQTSRPKLHETLKEGGRGAGGGRRQRIIRNLLVTAQVAMALALLGTAGALIRAFNHIYTADPGFNPANLLTLQIVLPEESYAQPRQVAAFYREALDRMARIPGVESTTLTTTLPLTLFPGGPTTPITLEGAADKESAKPTVVDLVVSPSYFETMEIPLIQGRGLTTQDNESSLRVAVVSKEMVQRHWAEADPIGRRFKLDGAGSDSPWISVVGVTEDVQTHAHSLRNPTLKMSHVFLPQAQNPRRAVAIVLRTAVEPLGVVSSVREAVWEIDKNQPVEDIRTMANVIARVDTQNTFFVRILTGLAVIALLLAGVGIYGVISYSVHQRSHEIGIRMALGAQPRSILYLVVKQGALLTAVGLLFGVAGAVALVRLMGSQLEGLQVSNASGPATFVTVSLVLLAVAKLASYIPARRAVRVDPVVTLRYE
jgi:putative ABC transport system permease protein